MPLKRKLITVGNSRAVVIPSDWLKYYEDKQGKPIEEVFLELNNIITISVETEEVIEKATDKSKNQERR